MLALAPRVRSGLSADATLEQVYSEAKYIAETHVIPSLIDLHRRLRLERGAFWRKLLQKVGSSIPGIVLKWVSGNAASTAVDAAKLSGGIAGHGIENDLLSHRLLENGGLGYLLSLETRAEKKWAANERSDGNA